MATLTMESTIQSLLAPGKGILAADESFPSIAKRFKEVNIPSTEENRRAYRDMLFATPGLNEFISGVILFDETLRQKMKSGVPMPAALTKLGIVPGIKVDLGAIALPNFPDEKFTQGLDGLRERLAEYVTLGARFTKWRAVIKIGEQLPTRTCIQANATMLAIFAALSQEAGLVPIVEPEVLMDGSHTLDRCEEVITHTLRSVFDTLSHYRVVLEQMVLKSSMVLSGKDCPQQADVPTVASATIRCFRRSVPAAVPGIVFLSGGQQDVEATQRLNAICKVTDVPWKITFSYGRALQAPALKTWRGSEGQIAAGQAALYHRAKCNGYAVQGKYSEQIESAKN
ncbi:MAG TPA: class I fructose-bisphosphate aldolase [Acidisarcina sp.]|nr:class I fructose-bisphosphate aldolase [Acidisarcina sp.]